MPKQKNELSFDENEAEALRQIVGDWLNEEIVIPPFEPNIEAVVKKLGLAVSKRTAGFSATQDQTLTSLKPQDQITGRPAVSVHQEQMSGRPTDSEREDQTSDRSLKPQNQISGQSASRRRR
jgi:hypothetical protein